MPLKVTTLVQDYIAAFHITDERNELTFQRARRRALTRTPFLHACP